MDQKWFISSTFGVLCFLNFSDYFHVASYTLSHSGDAYNDVDSKVWKSGRDQFPDLQENFRSNFREADGNLTEQPVGDNKRWLNVLTFDKHCNLTETDKGPQNETKKIFINTKEHLKIFESENEEEDDDYEDKLNSQLQKGREKNIFHLLSPEGFLSQIISQDQSRALERTKRQAEEDEKKRCRCRRKRRRGMNRRRRRRRRNRTGQQRRRRRRGGRRRNGRRRGRRRCVCRKKGEGEGKSEDGEETEIEEADGEEEEGTTEGGDETATGEDGEEGDGGEEGEEEGNEEGESGEEESDEEDEEEKEDDEENSTAPEGEMPSLNNIPTYMFPYPSMVEMPIAMMPVGRVPTGSYQSSTTKMYKMPSYLAVGALLSENNNSNIEE